jgi:hypothetical protein
MRNKILACLAMLSATLLMGAILVAVAYWRSSAAPEDPELGFDTNRLTPGQIVGSWKRVSIPEDENPAGGARQFTAAGKTATLYGDVIHSGTYKILDERTIETKYDYYKKKSEVFRWRYGFLDGKLVLVNEATGWIEAYERVQESIFVWL